MKTYQQNGLTLKRTNLAESGLLCDCCQDFAHGGKELEDDAVCEKCNALCCCDCHRPKTSTDA